MRFLKVIIVVLAVVTVGFFITGLATPQEFHGQLSVVLPESEITVWNSLTDIKHLPERRKEVTKVEMLGLNSKGNPYWKEWAGNDQYMIFEMAQQEYPDKLTTNMMESTFGMTGSWTYVLENGTDSTTRLTVIEDLKVTNFITRSILALTGRDRFLKREINSLRESFRKPK